jgi:hypothetical protein
MMKMHGARFGFALVKDACIGACSSAAIAAALIAVAKNVVLSRVAYGFVAAIAGDPFRSGIPKRNPSVTIYDYDSALQRFQRFTKNVRIFSDQHASARSSSFIGTPRRNFMRR